MKLFVRRFVFIRSWCHGQTSSSAFETKNKSTLRLIFVGHHKLQGAFRLLGNLGHLIRTGDQNAKSVEARWAFSCLARASSCPDYIFYFRCGDTTPDHSIKLLEVVWLKARIWSATTNSLEQKPAEKTILWHSRLRSLRLTKKHQRHNGIHPHRFVIKLGRKASKATQLK